MEQALRRRDQQIIMDKSQLEGQLPQKEKAKEKDGDIRRALFLRRQEIQGIGHKGRRKHDDVGAAVIIPGMCGVIWQGQGQDHIEDKECCRYQEFRPKPSAVFEEVFHSVTPASMVSSTWS